MRLGMTIAHVAPAIVPVELHLLTTRLLGQVTILPRNSDGHSNQFSETSRTHLVEHSGAVNLDGFLVDAEIAAYLLV